MRNAALLSLVILLSSMNILSQTPAEIAAAWDAGHISKMMPSDMRHSDLKNYLEQLKKLGIKVEQVGWSNAQREIYQMEWGIGPNRVFFWSQMHGDEPTATSALIDMFAYLQTHKDVEWVKRLSSALTIRAVPMLNPDGAEAFQRRNLQGLDINRDALDLATPEARLLKSLRDEWNPAIGFNLHNQQALTAVGRTGRQATISLLVVYGDAAKTTNYGHERNRRIASAIVTALNNFIPGHIAQYSDEYTPTAFGDNFGAWGTPVILIETGALHGKDEMYLVKMNFVAFMTAMATLSSGKEQEISPVPYDTLISNSSGYLYNYVFRNAHVVSNGGTGTFFTGDIAINTERRRASFSAPNIIKAMGKLAYAVGLEEYDLSNFVLVQRLGKARIGEFGEFLAYKKGRVVDWRSPDLERSSPPDAVFSTGEWIKGKELIPVIRN